MTFRCEACHEVQPSGERPTTVVLEERPRAYSTLDKDGNPHQGKEVVREMKVCNPCAELLQPEVSNAT